MGNIHACCSDTGSSAPPIVPPPHVAGEGNVSEDEPASEPIPIARTDGSGDGDGDEDPAPPPPLRAPKLRPRRNRGKKSGGGQQKEQQADVGGSRWVFVEETFSGSTNYSSMGAKLDEDGLISDGVDKFKQHPEDYLAIMYQKDMVTWPADQQKYTIIARPGTIGFRPTGCSAEGWMVCMTAKYQCLPPLAEFRSADRDTFTDSFEFNGKKLHHDANPPILPGRGMGVGDVPGLKIIGDIDPGDVSQGSVGDCWLLSAISALAEFDGAVKKLFAKTPQLEVLPQAGPNRYTITLFDLPSWTEVDVVVWRQTIYYLHIGRTTCIAFCFVSLYAVLCRFVRLRASLMFCMFVGPSVYPLFLFLSVILQLPKSEHAISAQNSAIAHAVSRY